MPQYGHNHIVTRSYLDLFALDGKVACHFVKTGECKNLAPASVGVRTDFYVLRNPDGSRNTTWEQAMGPSEDKAVRVLRSLEDRWPLASKDKATVAEFIAMHFVRGPAWREEVCRLSALNLPQLQRDHGLTDEQARDVTAWVASPEFQRTMFMRFLSRAMATFGSMHWTLLRFNSPIVMTSDQPVAPVPLRTDGPSMPSPIPSTGLANTVEVRFPVDAHRVLVLTWWDSPDPPKVRHVPRSWAANVNFPMPEQADMHYFHKPKASPPHRWGEYPALATLLFPGYSAETVRESERRSRASRIVTEMLESDEEFTRVIPMVQVEHRAA